MAETTAGRVAISIDDQGHDLSAPVCPQFGRAPHFLLVDEAGEAFEVVDNPNAEAPQGAGPATASLLIGEGATVVAAGRFGPKAQRALDAAGVIPVVVAPGLDAREALEIVRRRMGR